MSDFSCVKDMVKSVKVPTLCKIFKTPAPRTAYRIFVDETKSSSTMSAQHIRELWKGSYQPQYKEKASQCAKECRVELMKVIKSDFPKAQVRVQIYLDANPKKTNKRKRE